MPKNYQLLLDKTLDDLQQGAKPRLLLQVCCAPCSSYVLEYLNKHFDITLFFYNPNISPQDEYFFRADELKRLTREMPLETIPNIVVCDYDYNEFLEIASGKEDLPEGGARCFLCYELRLERTAQFAKEKNFDYFCTTLSISPHKNAQKLNEIGKALSNKYNVPYLFSDFKKKNGYKRSIELSKEYNLYRQDYCGCEFPKANSAQIKEK